MQSQGRVPALRIAHQKELIVRFVVFRFYKFLRRNKKIGASATFGTFWNKTMSG